MYYVEVYFINFDMGSIFNRGFNQNRHDQEIETIYDDIEYQRQIDLRIIEKVNSLRTDIILYDEGIAKIKVDVHIEN